MNERDRKIGKLTDHYIQRLFTERPYTPIIVTTTDNASYRKDEQEKLDDLELFGRIKKRLEAEHNGTDYTALCDVIYDRSEANHNLDYYGKHPDFWAGVHRANLQRANVIWLNSEKTTEVRKRELERFLQIKNEEYQHEGDYKEPNLAAFDNSDRCLGRSTRQVDEYVQKFIDLKPGEYIDVYDHYQSGNETMVNSYLCDRVCRRLKNEYKLNFYVHRGHCPRIVKVENDG